MTPAIALTAVPDTTPSPSTNSKTAGVNSAKFAQLGNDLRENFWRQMVVAKNLQDNDSASESAQAREPLLEPAQGPQAASEEEQAGIGVTPDPAAEPRLNELLAELAQTSDTELKNQQIATYLKGAAGQPPTERAASLAKLGTLLGAPVIAQPQTQ